MPKTLEEIELSCDPTLSSAEVEWWYKIWRDAEQIRQKYPPPAPERPGAERAAQTREEPCEECDDDRDDE